MALSEFEKIVRRFSSTLGSVVRNLAATGRAKKQRFSIFIDMILVVASLWLAYSLRYGKPFDNILPNFHLFILLPIISVLIFSSLGVYKWVIRSSNERLILSLVKGGVLSSLSLVIITFLFPPMADAPRSIFILFGLLFIGSSISIRQIWRKFFGNNYAYGNGKRVAIYGAGEAGQQLLELYKLDHNKNPIVFIDDNPYLQGTTLAGLPVISGNFEDISRQVQEDKIDGVVIALPSLKGQQYAEIVSKLSGLSVPVQTIPSIAELVSGLASPDQVRDLSVSDLLGRSIIEPDIPLMRKCVTAKVVLVTGGGGSIGSEICRQIAALDPAKLIVLEQSEENLYKITEELSGRFRRSDHGSFLPVLGSVTNKAKLRRLFELEKIDTVYHAAAYKHVPIGEKYPEEVIDVNIRGTLLVLDVSIEYEVEVFTLISTDKAVKPVNNMGASKRIAEMILQAKAALPHKTKLCIVRFGNVLGSSGSVLPKFKKQISEGGPVTITHRNITRYFMTIPESSQLVIQASALANGGEIFVLDMGEPVNIKEFAESLIKLSGKTIRNGTNPLGDIEILEIGLRPGEKMYEELFANANATFTPIKKIFVTHEGHVEWEELKSILIINGEDEIQFDATMKLMNSVKMESDRVEIQ